MLDFKYPTHQPSTIQRFSMTSDSRIYFMLMTAVAVAFIVFGWTGEWGYIHRLSLIAGGLYFGHLLTEALNYDSEGN